MSDARRIPDERPAREVTSRRRPMRFLRLPVVVMMLLGQISFSSAQPSQNMNIVGRWNLDRYEGLTNEMPTTPAWAEFRANGEVEVWDGCQRATSNYEIKGSLLKVGTFKGFIPCKYDPSPLGRLRGVFTQSLEGENGVRISGTKMKLRTSSLDEVLFSSADRNRPDANVPSSRTPVRSPSSESLARFFTEKQVIRVGELQTPVPDTFYACMGLQSGAFNRRIEGLRNKGREINRQLVINIVTNILEKEVDGGRCLGSGDEGGVINFQRIVRVLEGG